MTTSWMRTVFRITAKGGFPSQGPVMRNFDVFSDARLKKLLKNTVSLPVIWDAMSQMWRHCYANYSLADGMRRLAVRMHDMFAKLNT